MYTVYTYIYIIFIHCNTNHLSTIKIHTKVSLFTSFLFNHTCFQSTSLFSFSFHPFSLLFSLSVYNAFERFRFFTSPFLCVLSPPSTQITARCDDFHTVLNKDSDLISFHHVPICPTNPCWSQHLSCYLAIQQQEDCLPSKANENICVNCSG